MQPCGNPIFKIPCLSVGWLKSLRLESLGSDIDHKSGVQLSANWLIHGIYGTATTDRNVRIPKKIPHLSHNSSKICIYIYISLTKCNNYYGTEVILICLYSKSEKKKNTSFFRTNHLYDLFQLFLSPYPTSTAEII